MLLAYIGSKKVNSAEIARSMVLLAQLIKVPDRDELTLDALRLLAKQDIEEFGYWEEAAGIFCGS